MKKKQTSAYWPMAPIAILAVLVLLSSLTLSVADTTARCDNTVKWQTVVQQEELVTSDCLRTEGQTILLGSIAETSVIEIQFQAAQHTASTGIIYCVSSQPDALAAEMSTDEIAFSGDSISVFLILTPSEAAMNAPEAFDVDVQVMLGVDGQILKGTFRATLGPLPQETTVQVLPTGGTTTGSESAGGETAEEEAAGDSTGEDDLTEGETTEEGAAEETPSTGESTQTEDSEEPTEPETGEEPTDSDSPEESDAAEEDTETEQPEQPGEAADASANREALFSVRTPAPGTVFSFNPMTLQLLDTPAETEPTEEATAEEDSTDEDTIEENTTEEEPTEEDTTENGTAEEGVTEEDTTEDDAAEEETAAAELPAEQPASAGDVAVTTLAYFSLSGLQPVIIDHGETCNRLVLTIPGDFPAYTRYSLDGGASWYMLYYGGAMDVTLFGTVQSCLLLDLSGTQWSGDSLDLVAVVSDAQGGQSSAFASAALSPDVSVLGVDSSVNSIVLNTENTLVLPLMQSWAECDKTYAVERLTTMTDESTPLEPQTVLAYEPMAEDLFSVTFELDCVCVEIGDIRPPAGTYRLSIRYRYADVEFAESHVTFFVNYSEDVSFSGIGGDHDD